MIAKIKNLFFGIVVLLIFTGCTKQAGKIYLQHEAENLYGNVTYSQSLNTSDLIEWLNKTENQIMFKLSENKLIVCGDNRKVLFPKGMERIKDSDTLRVFDKLIFEDFLRKEKSNEVKIELRGSVLTFSGKRYTLEYSLPCPPFCE